MECRWSWNIWLALITCRAVILGTFLSDQIYGIFKASIIIKRNIIKNTFFFHNFKPFLSPLARESSVTKFQCRLTEIYGWSIFQFRLRAPCSSIGFGTKLLPFLSGIKKGYEKTPVKNWRQKFVNNFYIHWRHIFLKGNYNLFQYSWWLFNKLKYPFLYIQCILFVLNKNTAYNSLEKLVFRPSWALIQF